MAEPAFNEGPQAHTDGPVAHGPQLMPGLTPPAGYQLGPSKPTTPAQQELIGRTLHGPGGLVLPQSIGTIQ
jgi:hypothetical protein